MASSATFAHQVALLRSATRPAQSVLRWHSSRRLATQAANEENRRCLVVGGCGGLGAPIVEAFSRTPGWHCTSLDFRESTAAHENVISHGESEFAKTAPQLLNALPDDGFDAIVHAAGSWAGSDPGEADFPQSLQRLWRANVESAALAAHVAGRLLRPNGMLVLTGAKVASDVGGTPGMAAYGMTKAATHHLVESVAADLTDGRRAFAILPVTIDTAANRSAMPCADTSAWTDPEDIAREILEWAQAASNHEAAEGQLRRLPENGSHVLVLTESKQTRFVYPTGAPVANVGLPGGREWRQSVKTSKGFSPPTFHHVNVVSREVGVMHEFYRDVVMMDDLCPASVVQRTPGNAETGEGYSADIAFTTDGSMQMHIATRDLNIAFRNGEVINPVERGHIAFRTDDIQAYKRHLDEHGVYYSDYGTTFAAEWHQLFFLDPEGMVVEVHQAISTKTM